MGEPVYIDRETGIMYDENYDEIGPNISYHARKVQGFFHSVPEQMSLVSNLASNEARKVRNEIRKVAPRGVSRQIYVPSGPRPRHVPLPPRQVIRTPRRPIRRTRQFAQFTGNGGNI